MGRAVTFDLGNVLVFFSFPRMLKQMAQCTGLSEKQIEEHFFKTKVREHYETGMMNTKELIDSFRAIAPKKFSRQSFLDAISDIFTPNEPIFPILHGLKKRGHQLFLLSNTCEAHFDFLLPKTPVLQLFDHHVLSYKVGAAKPHPSIYQEVVERAGVKPKDLFYTDDIPEFVHAAKMLSIDAELFTDVKLLQKQLESRKLL